MKHCSLVMKKHDNTCELEESWEQCQNYLLLINTRLVFKRKTLIILRDWCQEFVKCINLLTSDSLKIYNVKRKIKFEIKVHLIPRSLSIDGWKIKAALNRIQKPRPADTQCL